MNDLIKSLKVQIADLKRDLKDFDSRYTALLDESERMNSILAEYLSHTGWLYEQIDLLDFNYKPSDSPKEREFKINTKRIVYILSASHFRLKADHAEYAAKLYSRLQDNIKYPLPDE